MRYLFFNATATTEIYTLSLHDALPIFVEVTDVIGKVDERVIVKQDAGRLRSGRSEEHTSELQSQSNLVCRLLLEKKNSALSSITESCVAYFPPGVFFTEDIPSPSTIGI